MLPRNLLADTRSTPEQFVFPPSNKPLSLEAEFRVRRDERASGRKRDAEVGGDSSIRSKRKAAWDVPQAREVWCTGLCTSDEKGDFTRQPVRNLKLLKVPT